MFCISALVQRCFGITCLWRLSGWSLICLWLLSAGILPAWASDIKEDEGIKWGEGCTGNAQVNEICQDPQDDKSQDTAGESTGSAGAQAVLNVGDSGEKPVATCEEALGKAEECCDTPTACLGTESLATLEKVNNIVARVGPGMATMLQGFGKDMSEMCKTFQMLSAGGASVAVAASTKCKVSVGSCKSQCEKEIKVKCKEYTTFKTTCKTECDTTLAENGPSASAAPDEECKSAKEQFNGTGKTAAERILKLRDIKKQCNKQALKIDNWDDQVGQLATGAISAEMCKQQARAMNNEADCKKAGGTWKDGECDIPQTDQEKCEEAGMEWHNDQCVPPMQTPPNSSGNNTTPVSGLTAETETAEKGRTSNTEESNNNKKTGSGGNSKNQGIGLPESGDLSGGGAETNTDESATDDSSAKTQSGSGGLFGSSSGGRRYWGRGRNNKEGSEDEDSDNLRMGGGGFASYGRGGSGGGDSEEDFAGLRLSKKKLKEMEKKKGALRKTASEMGGAHQNIFERITKRFKSLCQKDLDCQ